MHGWSKLVSNQLSWHPEASRSTPFRLTHFSPSPSSWPHFGAISWWRCQRHTVISWSSCQLSFWRGLSSRQTKKTGHWHILLPGRLDWTGPNCTWAHKENLNRSVQPTKAMVKWPYYVELDQKRGPHTQLSRSVRHARSVNHFRTSFCCHMRAKWCRNIGSDSCGPDSWVLKWYHYSPKLNTPHPQDAGDEIKNVLQLFFQPINSKTLSFYKVVVSPGVLSSRGTSIW